MRIICYLLALCFVSAVDAAQRFLDSRSERPDLHGRHWMAITGKPLSATAGALIFPFARDISTLAVKSSHEGIAVAPLACLNAPGVAPQE